MLRAMAEKLTRRQTLSMQIAVVQYKEQVDCLQMEEKLPLLSYLLLMLQLTMRLLLILQLMLMKKCLYLYQAVY